MGLRKPLLFGSPAVMLAMVVGWFAGSARSLFGSPWITRIIVWLLVGAIAFVAYRIVRRRAAPAVPSGDPDPLDRLLKEARAKLAAGGLRSRRILGELPLVLILGPRGSTKTSVVLNSGTQSEHLAGELYYGGAVARTDSVNVWFHARHLIVEAGGQLVVEPARWADLIRRFRPRRGLAHLFGKSQAPRVAVVCFSCEELVRGGGGEAILAAASNLRSRLVEYAEAMGVRLPVYVVFTKADSIPHFTAFTERLSDSEAAELLGVTLPALPEAAVSSYSDAISQRIKAGFERLGRSLSRLRIDVMGRIKPGAPAGEAYEFPREFGKVSGPAVTFLQELCRPGQLPRMSPFLRGFYFVGVRPVLDSSGQPAAAPVPLSTAAPAGATQIMDPAAFQAMAAASVAPQARSQRIPQWVFLRHLFTSVFLADRIALGVSRSGQGLRVFRRAALAALLAAVSIVGVTVAVSYARDRGLQSEVEAALLGVADLGAVAPANLTLDEVGRLDRLREVTSRLSRYEHGVRPLRRFYGLYTGGGLYEVAREAYLGRLGSVLLNPARSDMQRTLDNLPNPPTPTEFDRAYAALKATIELVEAPDRAEAPFFRSTLTSHWEAAGSTAVDSEVRERVADQFEFLGDEIQYGSPWAGAVDLEYQRMVANTRAFLRDNTSDESIYAGLVRQANSLPSFSFAQAEPGATQDVAGPVVIPGAFTKDGWNQIQAAIADPAQFLVRDQHVVGEGYFARADAQSLGGAVLDRYRSEYVARWISYLEEASVQGFAFGQASDGLDRLSGNQSPLFLLFRSAARQTDVEDDVLSAVFSPLHQVVAPDSVGRLWSDQAIPYMQALANLAEKAAQLEAEPGEASIAGVSEAATQVSASARIIRQAFPFDPPRAVRVGNAVFALMDRPIEATTNTSQQGLGVALNDSWRQTCRNDRAPLNLYPFNRSDGGAQDASIDDVNQFLHPESGRLWAFHTENAGALQDDRAYQAFMDRARAIRDDLYGPSATAPAFSFVFRADVAVGAADVTLNVNGNVYRYAPNDANDQTVVWQAIRTGEVTLTDRDGGTLNFQGPWSIYEFFDAGSLQSIGGGAQEATWTLDNGRNVSATVRFRGDVLVDSNYFAGLRCPARIG